jgi:ubiquinone/menaquinone biosynthesis C-methylase UbiE
MPDIWDIIKLLSDSTRSRILAILKNEELSVAELQDVLDMGQSRISSHLSLMRQSNLLIDRKEGKKTFYVLNEALSESLNDLIDSILVAISDSDDVRLDRENLKRVLEKRKQHAEEYFNSVAGRLGKDYCPGRSWEAIGHMLLLLTSKLTIADLGAGEGLISQLLARGAEKVYCVDNAPKMVEFGKALADKNKLTNLEYLLGDIESIPLKDSSVEVALLSQALHHANHPQKALMEAFRILKPNGRVIILDLLEHDFEKTRELYADIWLGFSENKLYQMLKESGFKSIEMNVVSKEEKEPNFQTILASAIKT